MHVEQIHQCTSRPGKNIAGGLHIMEHLNNIAKGAIRFQGKNNTQSSISRIGRSIGTLGPVLARFDDQNKVPTTTSTHEKADARKDISVVASELTKAHRFIVQKGRKNRHFPRPKNLLKSKNREDLLHWLEAKLPKSF